LLRLSESIVELVTPAAASDLSAIVDLLEASGLPTADVRAGSGPQFWVARHDGRVIGVIGLERFGKVGLLRSLAVSSEHRRTGLGVALTQALETHAMRSGVTSLVLLTETAVAFFERLHYRVVARGDAPSAARQSAEFRTLCPDSAVCMIRDLDSGKD
jgi:amino-acid N-acetyltransferase